MNDEMAARVASILEEAGQAHHDFETEELGGERDEDWAAWYSRFALDRGLVEALGAAPEESDLARTLTNATEEHSAQGSDEPWARFAGERVAARFGA